MQRVLTVLGATTVGATTRSVRVNSNCVRLHLRFTTQRESRQRYNARSTRSDEGGVPSLRVDGYSQADAEQLRDALALRTGWCVEVRGEGRGRRLVLLSEGAADQIAAWQREAGIPTMQHSAPGGR